MIDEYRRRIDEMIAYHFQHPGELSVARLLRRFGIGTLYLEERLYEIRQYYLETGELPFAPELNVDIATYEQFERAAERYCLEVERRRPWAIETVLPIPASTLCENGANRYAAG